MNSGKLKLSLNRILLDWNNRSYDQKVVKQKHQEEQEYVKVHNEKLSR